MMYRALMLLAALPLAVPVKTLPRQAQEHISDGKTCAFVQNVVSGISARGPQQLDRWTSLDGVEIDCPHREVTFRQSFSAPAEILADGWKARLAQSFSLLHCGPTGPLREAVQQGWAIGITLKTDAGFTKITANCPLPEA